MREKFRDIMKHRVHYQFVNCYPRLFGFRCQGSGIS